MYWCRGFINSGVVGCPVCGVSGPLTGTPPGDVPDRPDRHVYLSRHTHKRPTNLRSRNLRDRTLGNVPVWTVFPCVCRVSRVFGPCLPGLAVCVWRVCDVVHMAWCIDVCRVSGVQCACGRMVRPVRG